MGVFIYPPFCLTICQGALVRLPHITYQVIEVLYIRAGVATTPVVASFGLGLKIKALRIDIATSYHTTLGLSPSLSVSYALASSSTKPKEK